ncbi:unnamed protein product [Ectocarpus sp. CCAP 1310/34]|nr:unnamed protein product [Ectocarpus sp. CCAP 1310/34]
MRFASRALAETAVVVSVADNIGAIGFAAVVDFIVALLLIHIVLFRQWPPYKAVHPGLIVYTGLATMLATVWVSIRYGMWGDVVDCSGVSLAMFSLGALFSCGVVRVYRYHNVLVRHSGVMLPVTVQVATLLLPFLIGPAMVLARADDATPTFDSTAGECLETWQPPDISEWVAAGILAAVALALAFRLRIVRSQAPHEFLSAVATSASLALAVVSLPLVETIMRDTADETAMHRRRTAMLVITALVGMVVVAAPVLHPLRLLVFKDDEFNSGGVYGFGKWGKQTESAQDVHVQSQIRWVDNLVRRPGRDALGQASATDAACFLDMVARDEEEDYCLRQAATMRILDTYLRDGAPRFVPLSAECRGGIVRSMASSVYTFGRAREEILDRLNRTAAEQGERGPMNHTRSEKVNSNNNNAGNDNDTCGRTQKNSGKRSKRDGVRPRPAPRGQQHNTGRPKLFFSGAASKSRKCIRGIEMQTNTNGKSNRADERSLNDSVTVKFGLKNDREDDTFSYTSSAKTHFSVRVADGEGSNGLAIVRASSDESDDDDLGEVSRAIANPIFGDMTRAVGRQPKNKR